MSTRGTARQKELRIERAAELLQEPITEECEVKKQLVEEFNVSIQTAREYVREAQKLLAPTFDIEELRYKHDHIDRQAELVINECIRSGNLNGAVGGLKIRSRLFEKVREIDPAAAWDRQMTQAFCEETYPPNPNKTIPRERIGKDLDSLDNTNREPFIPKEYDNNNIDEIPF